MRATDSSATVWANSSLGRGSPKLLFGWTHEDAAIELQAFAGLRRIFCIASAGCTAMALAAGGHDVTAVDINPCQVEYARARAEGAPARPGAVERLVARGRTLLPFLGWRRATVREFLSLDDTNQQTEFWEQRLDTRRWRAALSVLLAPRLLALVYASPGKISLRQFVRSPGTLGRLPLRARTPPASWNRARPPASTLSHFPT
jgi:SAM-dependent methyltransferase